MGVGVGHFARERLKGGDEEDRVAEGQGVAEIHGSSNKRRIEILLLGGFRKKTKTKGSH